MNYLHNNKCILCGSQQFEHVHKGVRGAADINVVKCQHCGLTQLDRFIGDLNKFYEESNMRPVEKTIQEIRNATYNDDYRRYIFVKNMIENKSLLDFGAGAGGFLSLTKNTAKYICGIELEKPMRKQIKEEDGTDCFTNIKEIEGKKFDIITMFHVLEHLPNPVETLQSLAKQLSDEGRIIIEVPNADDALLSLYNSQAFADFTYWMCHLYYYNNNSLSNIIKKSRLKVQFIEQIQRYPLANHLFWLSKSKPGGHQHWPSLCDMDLDRNYGKKLASLGIADTIIAIISK